MQTSNLVLTPYQGAVAGAVVSCGLLFWIMLGSYSIKKFQTDILPSITDQCNATASGGVWENDIWATDSIYTSTSQPHISWMNETDLSFNSQGR